MNCTVMLEPRRGGRKKPNYFDHLFPDPERWLKKAEPSIEQPGLFRPPFRGWSKKAEQPFLGSVTPYTLAYVGLFDDFCTPQKKPASVTAALKVRGHRKQKAAQITLQLLGSKIQKS